MRRCAERGCVAAIGPGPLRSVSGRKSEVEVSVIASPTRLSVTRWCVTISPNGKKSESIRLRS